MGSALAAEPAAVNAPRPPLQARAAGARRLAWLLDDIIRIPGTNIRFGIDPLLGLLPGGGDLAGGVLSGYIILAAARAGAPPTVLVRMAANVLLDAVAGVVPLLGDLFDAGYKANRRNAVLLEEFLTIPGTTRRSGPAVVAIILGILALVIVGAAVGSVVIIRWIIGLF
jgi:hypothetical protein